MLLKSPLNRGYLDVMKQLPRDMIFSKLRCSGGERRMRRGRGNHFLLLFVRFQSITPEDYGQK